MVAVEVLGPLLDPVGHLLIEGPLAERLASLQQRRPNNAFQPKPKTSSPLVAPCAR